MRSEFPKKLGDYKFALDVAGDASKNIILKNSNNNKAEYAISKIFELSKRELCIFAGDLAREEPRSNVYIKNLIGFLKRNKSNKIKVVLEKNNLNSEGLNILKILKNQDIFKNQISLKSLKPDYEISKTKHEKKFHFSINPEKGIYRFEYDTVKRKAHLNFNDEKYTSILNNLFDKYYENSDEISSTLDSSDEINKLRTEILHDFLKVA